MDVRAYMRAYIPVARREKDVVNNSACYSSNVSSLSRGSITPVSVPNTSSPANSSLPAYTKPQGWIGYDEH